MKKLIFLIISLTGLNLQAQQDGPERIRGFIPSLATVHVQVDSGGCTSKSDFYVKTTTVGERKHIAFFRRHEDECLALFPVGVTLSFSYSELGLERGDQFKITNPIADGLVQ